MRQFAVAALVAAMPFAAGTFDMQAPADQGLVVLAKITKTNGGGNTPGGNANGVPSTNPTGQAPPGQNKKSTGN
jgi:hypothetical protein